ncbi:hypothetical protein D1007_41990 [Hordeum vulgare]|nr:hypothetical protein D1007_41990 [Hordeum vulgare]
MSSPSPAGAAASPHLPHLLLPATTTTTVGAGAGAATMEARQEGQVAQVRSQASMQSAWKAWPHRGRTRTPSPSANSARHIAHSIAAGCGEAAAAKETVGSASIAFFLRPFGGGSEEEVELERRRRHAHREARASPSTQTTAHSSDARMTVMSESTAIGAACSVGCCGEAGDDDVSVVPAAVRAAARCRTLAGARMAGVDVVRNALVAKG